MNTGSPHSSRRQEERQQQRRQERLESIRSERKAIEEQQQQKKQRRESWLAATLASQRADRRVTLSPPQPSAPPSKPPASPRPAAADVRERPSARPRPELPPRDAETARPSTQPLPAREKPSRPQPLRPPEAKSPKPRVAEAARPSENRPRPPAEKPVNAAIATIKVARKQERKQYLERQQQSAARKQAAASRAPERPATSAPPPRERPAPASFSLPPAPVAPSSSERSSGSAPMPDPDLTLSWLGTQGPFIVDENGVAVVLRGVTLEGLNAATTDLPFSQSLGLDQQNLDAITGNFGFNVVRLPFISASLIDDSGAASNGFLTRLDDLLSEISGNGLYAMLALTPAAPEIVAPTARDLLAWKTLAARYHDDSAVLYEAFSSAAPLDAAWLDIAQILIGTIRREHTASLIVIGNGSPEHCAANLPLRFSTGDPIHNLVYAVPLHPALEEGERLQMLNLSRSFPLMATQWKETEQGLEKARVSDDLVKLLQALGASWIAGNWNAEPRVVVASEQANFRPTRFGQAVQRALASPARLQLRPYEGPADSTQ